MMIAALAGTTQAKNNAMHAIGLDLRWRRFQSQGTSELGAIERDERHGDDRPDQRDRPHRQGEFGVVDVREAAGCR